MERGARLSGARFAYLRGDLVLLELALVQWALDKLRGHGFEPVIPPVLVREEALYGTGFLPDTEQQIYQLADDDLYLVGTSEVALASLHAGEILDADDAAAALRRLLAVLPPRGGRRRQGHARHLPRAPVRQGRDVLVRRAGRVAAMSTSGCSAIEEEILGELELPYRVVNIAVDDLGASAAKKYDCEAWLPGQGRYRELTSTSNTTDFQARRLEIRYRAARAASRRRCTRSTAPPSPSAARSSRCSRTASARTARSALPARWPLRRPVRRACRPAARPADVSDAPRRGRGDVERVVQARDLKEPQDGRVGAHEGHPTAASGDAAQPVEQHAQSGRVDELDAAEVEHERGLAALDRVRQPLGELRRRRRQWISPRTLMMCAPESGPLLAELEVGDDRGHGPNHQTAPVAPCQSRRGRRGDRYGRIVRHVTSADDTELTIDELGRRIGMTVRNIRAASVRGLLPPPEVRGRTGYYGPDHVARLELIQELQAEGMPLELIKRLLDRSGGSSSELLSFKKALERPWSGEETRTVGSPS